jgi:aryl-alcohol dehydrogenase-like predicted oxidoreductase
MHRRDFLRRGTSVAAAGFGASERLLKGSSTSKSIPRRHLGRTGIDLSIIGFGGILVMNAEQAHANNLVAEAFDRGVVYYDVAPSYGNAQQILGPALEPYRNRVTLNCKTTDRTRDGSAKELDESLRLLRTDHVDVYQMHALTKMEELNTALGSGGCLETFVSAKKAGKIRFIGFSAHSVETALAALDRFDFDTILFPTNFVLFSQAGFGPQVIARAREKNMGIMALKAMAKTKWPESIKESERPYPKCWYQPCGLPEEARMALRWTLSQPITAAVPPGDELFFRVAMDVAQNFEPLSESEQKQLIASAAGVTPIFELHKA